MNRLKRIRLANCLTANVVCHIALWLTLFGILAVSCEQEEGGGLPLQASVAASFVPTVGGESVTRVIDDRWSGSEVVGIAAFDAKTGKPVTARYHQYTPDGDKPGTRVQLVPAASENAIFYPVDGREVTFTAFSPYPEIQSPILVTDAPVTYPLTKQSTDINYMEELDFIYHKGTVGYSQDAPVAALNFEHKLCWVVINLTRGSGYTNDVAEAIAWINNVYAGVSVDLSNGEVTASDAGTILPYRSFTGDDACTFQAIVAPQTSSSTPSASDRTLTIMVNSISYDIDIPQDWEAGMSYTYDFELTDTGLVLAGSAVVSRDAVTVAWDMTGKAITIDKNALNFDYTAYTQTVVIKVKGITGRLIASVSTSAESITGTPTCISSNLPITPVGTEGDWVTYTLSVTSTYNPYSSINREAFVHVQVDRLSVVIEVTQLSRSTLPLANGNTNCFMVAPGATIYFPVTRAITHGGAAPTATFTPTKLWDDTSGGAVASYSISNNTGSNAVISVTAGSNPGNALIAVKDNSSGTTYWSWHIWVTDYDPSKPGTTFTNTLNTNNKGSYFVFMDRNLGATAAGAYGLYYQWGRKDPFPSTGDAGATQPGGGSFTAVATDHANGTIANTIKNPNVFYWGVDASSGDWHWGITGSARTDRDDTLWGHGNRTVKSVYDPCPAGWRVPSHNVAASAYASTTASPWYGFTESASSTIPANLNPAGFSNGYSWGTNALYPAAGSRYYNSGALTNVGTNGYCWSASPTSSTSGNASNLNLSNGSVNVSDNSRRAYGCPVRCIREN